MSNESLINNIKNLTSQTKNVFCVINFPMRKDGTFNLNTYNLKQFRDDLERSSCLYALALHDKDVDDNGELKTPHIHLHMTFATRHQIKFYLYLIADLLNCNENLISVHVSTSQAGDIQYLTHKNQPNKFQYDKSIIFHNFNESMFDDLYNVEVIQSLTASELINLCREHNKLELIEILGPARFNTFSKTINEIYKELKFERLKRIVNSNNTSIYDKI